MHNVASIASNGKPAAEHIDWMTGEEIFPDSYPDEPNFDGPTPAEEREGAEIMATFTIDRFAPRVQPLPEFLHNQARLARIREDSPQWLWLAGKLDELAKRAEILHATDPATYDDREPALLTGSLARQGYDQAREIAASLERTNCQECACGYDGFMLNGALDLIAPTFGR